MNASIPARAAVLILFFTAPLISQDDSVKSWLDRLASPFAAERHQAVNWLVDNKIDQAMLIPLLAAERPAYVRIGAASVLEEVGGASAALALDTAARRSERGVNRALFGSMIAVLARVEENDARVAPIRRRLAENPDARRLARQWIASELERLDSIGTEWSHHPRLSRFHRLEPVALDAMSQVLADEEAPELVRCLAAVAIGRLDAKGFFFGPDGKPAAAFRSALDDATDNVKTAVVYAAASSGIEDERFLKAMATYAAEDAVGPHLIEACLYLLYTLPDRAFDRIRPSARILATEYAGDFHGERMHYNAGVMLKRLGEAALAVKCVSHLAEADKFGDFFLYQGVLDCLMTAQAEHGALIDRVLKLALAHNVPQIRALGYHIHEVRHGHGPVGVTREAVLEAVRLSAVKGRSSEEDADAYNERSAGVILGLMKDGNGARCLGALLKHSNEAVKMAAAMAAGDCGLKGLASPLFAMSQKPQEFARFGAAYGLAQLGDERCLPAFAELLACGNLVLARPSLVNLRRIAKRELAKDELRTHADYRARARLWRASLRQASQAPE